MFKVMISALAVVSFVLPGAAGALEVGDPAPDLHVHRWWNGPPVGRLSEPGDTVYIVAFWATWSRPAVESLPSLARLQQDLGASGVRIIALTHEDDAALNAFLAQEPAAKSLTIAADDAGQTTAAWLQAAGEAAVPHAFVVDREGRVAWQGHPDDLRPIVERVLAGTFEIKRPQPVAVADRSPENDEPAMVQEKPQGRRRITGEDDQPNRNQPEEPPPSAQLRRLLARAVQSGQWEQAVRLIDALLEQIEQQDDEHEVPGLLGTKFVFLYEMLRNYGGAEATARRLLDLGQDDAEALNTLAWTLLARGDFESLAYRWPEIAHEAARRALEASSRSSSAIMDTYARSLYLQGHVESAVQWQQKAVDQAREDLDQARSDGADEEFISRSESNISALQISLDYYQQILQYRQRSEQ